MLGKKSGLDSIRIKVAELGLDVPEERFPAILDAVKRAGTKKRGLVTDGEFRRMARRESVDVLKSDRPERRPAANAAASGIFATAIPLLRNRDLRATID